MKLYPSTRVEWPDPADAPDADRAVIEDAHVTWHGNRLTIRANAESGRKDVIDTIYDATEKGSGSRVTVTGVSTFMVQNIGLTPEESEVTVVYNGERTKCLNC